MNNSRVITKAKPENTLNVLSRIALTILKTRLASMFSAS